MFDAYRSHGAGTLRAEHDGTPVTLSGWVARRRDHGGVAFIDLRDASGVVQVVADPTQGAALEAAHDLRSEYVVKVTGAVRVRPEGMRNPALATGDIEVAATEVEVLAAAETPPFAIEDRIDVDETLRLQHRYLDLRRPQMAEALRLRSRVTSIMRRVMEEHGFLDIETPILTRSTPEGARDFLVPSRLQSGNVYALPQSPQLFKQLLMVAGMDRYYQIARCFRDEDLRADRQPEFTQLDVEASFVVEEDIYTLVEGLLTTLWRECLGEEIPTPFPRLPYAEAMRRYGSDKPDTRFGLEILDLNETFKATEVGVFRGALDAGGSVLAIRLPAAGDMTRKNLDDLQEWAKGRGAKGLAWAMVEDSELRSPLTKFMAEAEVEGLLEVTGAQPGDALFFAAGETRFSQELLGALRGHLARQRGLVPEGRWDFLWITEPPVVEWNADEERWDAVHHPFTAPTEASLARLEEAPGEATARAYDVVLNGVELGGGSIRIHRRDVQSRVFRLLGIDDEQAEAKFGFLLKGLSYGAPPHGGIAFGLDRMIMLMAGMGSIRDVMAFPKTASGGDPMTGAPSPADAAQLREVGLRPLPPPAKG
jgi:aspartyl-tRNA synthetase